MKTPIGKLVASSLVLSAAFFVFLTPSTNAAPLNYTNDVNVLLSTPAITLVVKAGSAAEGLVVNAGSVEVTLAAGETFVVTSPQTLGASVTGVSGSVTVGCLSAIETNTIVQSSGTGVYTLTPTGSACVSHSSAGGGGGGGGGVSVSPSVSLSIPDGGNVFAGGSVVGVTWSSANGAFVKYRVSYSSDNGSSWTVVAAAVNSTSYSWTVPGESTTQGRIKIEGLDASGAVLASDTSASSFTVNGTTVAVPVVVPPADVPPAVEAPATDSTALGSYSPSVALANTTDINTDKGITVAGGGTSSESACESGSLIKGSLPAVYYCGANGKRYVFPNERVYKTWYSDFSGVRVLSDATIASIMLGGNVTYRPGVKMVKAQTDPKVYVISRGGVLRWIPNETVAASLYGANWNRMIDYVPDAFWLNYTIGEPLGE